jgi:hypothetical protein
VRASCEVESHQAAKTDVILQEISLPLLRSFRESQIPGAALELGTVLSVPISLPDPRFWARQGKKTFI